MLLALGPMSHTRCFAPRLLPSPDALQVRGLARWAALQQALAHPVRPPQQHSHRIHLRRSSLQQQPLAPSSLCHLTLSLTLPRTRKPCSALLTLCVCPVSSRAIVQRVTCLNDSLQRADWGSQNALCLPSANLSQLSPRGSRASMCGLPSTFLGSSRRRADAKVAVGKRAASRRRTAASSAASAGTCTQEENRQRVRLDGASVCKHEQWSVAQSGTGCLVRHHAIPCPAPPAAPQFWPSARLHCTCPSAPALPAARTAGSCRRQWQTRSMRTCGAA